MRRRFRFQSKSLYKWTNDQLTSDFPVFPEFQKKLLGTIKAKSLIDLTIRKGEYTVVLDLEDFKRRLQRHLKDKFNLSYLDSLIEESRKENGNVSTPGNTAETKALEELILHNAFRKFNLNYRTADEWVHCYRTVMRFLKALYEDEASRSRALKHTNGSSAT